MFKKLVVAGLAFAAVTSTQVITANAAPVEAQVQAQKGAEIAQRASVPFKPNACVTVKKVLVSPNNTTDWWVIETMAGTKMTLDQSIQVGGWFKTVKAGSEIEVMMSPQMDILYGWRIL